MNAQMEKAEATMAMTAMAMPALRRLALEVWHKMNACSCDQGWFLPGILCEIGREEFEEKRRLELFAQWDALGLGYIGPVLKRERA